MKYHESSIQGRFVRELIRQIRSDNLLGKKLKDGTFRKKMKETEPDYRVPEGFRLTGIKLKNFYMEYLEAEEEGFEKVILQLHGGGYVGTLTNIYRKFAEIYAKTGKAVSVLSIDYRVAPDNPYPAALEDAVTAYFWLKDKGFLDEQIILAGDSAGGGLAMATCMYLRDHVGLRPAGVLTMSAWADLTASGQSYSENFEVDPVFGNTRDSIVFNSEYIGDEDPKNPYISPVFGDFSGFPPMLMQVGTEEMLLSDTLTIAAKAKNQGVDVCLSVYEGMFHVFQMALKFIPESKKAWQEAAEFISRL
ncbi:alpha/beta hydrolase [Parasporobacterium paucivorans]|uniref:Acetyl esterase/lipase n=1 Tax=Parasporobacterium paucivorans DSM 15970 TaxID=1122934 RepID=A0A1M6JBM3_9FIRM|nr:alpha/beta hydrolase [Parasporobacterium paucivorans]SHJ44146.1 Acetyl esterase/lipase [Parasporobacterium paucivorans DSM 15970]